ncbi:MAG: 16S rRNA (cytidine(1402)-2'-O)-methyltransferase [Alphaproteobacteria bacterium]|nr:16S rRNA (cytidine(1402)-2'-O)-methyltransferase [Alphaproteobacteria bacterium]
MLKGGLYIVATPIGNLQDISERAKNVLAAADVVACEDTRVSKKLFSLLGLKIDKPFVCYEDHREERTAQILVQKIKDGAKVALVSDAGSPLISDPGFKLVRLCRQENLHVEVVPGASAVICALELSGLPTNRFMFLGFVPNKEKARRDLFEEVKNVNTTLVFYETAPRLLQTLEAMTEMFSGREICVVREMTKIYEQSINATAAELAAYFKQNPAKGEIVVVVEPPKEQLPDLNIKQELKTRLKKMSLKEAAKEVAAFSGLKKSDVYELGLRLKNEQ